MMHKPCASRSVEHFEVFLVLLACAVLETVRFNAQWLNMLAGVLTGCVIVIAFCLRWRFSRVEYDDGRLPDSIAMILFGFATIPTGMELAVQHWFGLGQAVEFHAAVWLRNLMLAMVATSFWRGHLRLAVLLSFFLVIFASSLAEDFMTWVLTTVYGVVGLWWLAASYWSNLQGHFLAESKRRIPLRIQRRRLVPCLAAFVMLLAVLTPLLVGTSLFGTSATTAIAGWFSTSGGTGDYDPFARAGLNDGDALVRGTENATSVGPVESDVFLSSDQPSLYDVFNDMYGEPFKPKTMERAVSLQSPRSGPKQEQKWAESKRISREFSTVRNRPAKKQQAVPDNTESPALLYIAGRTPLHLRVQAFNTFDGITWTSKPDAVENQRRAAMTIQLENEKPWLTTGLSAAFSQSPHTDLHVLKIVNLDTNHIPSPAHLVRLHIDKIDRADFFAWADGDVVQMTRERVPPLTVIRMASQVPSNEQLQELQKRGGCALQPDAVSAVPKNRRTAEIGELAKRWAGDSQRGWSQVAAVASHLRQEYEHDPTAIVPTTCDDSVSHFLLESHRGPDYQFASAAAILLRHLGYSTRVVSGFYAAPQNLDSRSHHTPVLAKDVHFWAEVELGGGRWATIEATPGYEVLEPPATIWQQCLAAARTAWLWCSANVLSLIVGCVALTGIVRYRRDILNALATCLWRIAALRSPEVCISATMRLLDRRCRWANRARPAYITPARWYGNCLGRKECDAESESMWRTFPIMLNWYFYAPVPTRRRSAAWTRQEVRRVCLSAVRFWSLRQCCASDSLLQSPITIPHKSHQPQISHENNGRSLECRPY